jgi:hypothetical protein
MSSDLHGYVAEFAKALVQAPRAVELASPARRIVACVLTAPGARRFAACVGAVGLGLVLVFLTLRIAPTLGFAVQPVVISDRTAWVDENGGGFSVIGESGAPYGKSFDARAARGRECLTPLTGGQGVEFGIVTVPAGKEPGGELVVWIRCL